MPDLSIVLGGEKGTTVETPSGLSIYYEPEPNRHYKVNGVRVPSVTEVLGVLHKPALLWWSMKTGVDGMLRLYSEHNVPFYEMDSVDTVVELLKAHRLTCNHVRDKAGNRGTSVHNAFERYCLTGHKPNPDEFPEEERGYVEGLLKFIEAVNPEPEKTELMVGSAVHGYAGRFDLLATTENRTVQPTPRKKRVIPVGRGIWDLKTGKDIYPNSHFLQTSAYRLALEESYGIRSDYEAIVNVREDGSWDVGVSNKQPSQFLAVREVWGALR